jgi:addiction module HigA family antidote
MTPYRLAKELHVSEPRVYDLVRGKRGISAEMALRLARYFGTSPEFWLNLQVHYELELEEDKAGGSIEREVHPLGA